MQDDVLRVIESKHCMSTLVFLSDHGPSTKMEIYDNVSKNPTMPEKIESMEAAGLLTIETVSKRSSEVTLTRKGEMIAELLKKIQKVK